MAAWGRMMNTRNSAETETGGFCTCEDWLPPAVPKYLSRAGEGWPHQRNSSRETVTNSASAPFATVGKVIWNVSLWRCEEYLEPTIVHSSHHGSSISPSLCLGPQSFPSTQKGVQELNLESKVWSGIDGEGMYILLVLTYCPSLKSETNLNLSGWMIKECA